MVRTEPTAEASFAAMRERSKLGMAIAAMINMIATTISNSINEKPFCLRICLSSPVARCPLKTSAPVSLAPVYSHLACQDGSCGTGRNTLVIGVKNQLDTGVFEGQGE